MLTTSKSLDFLQVLLKSLFFNVKGLLGFIYSSANEKKVYLCHPNLERFKKNGTEDLLYFKYFSHLDVLSEKPKLLSRL